MNDLLKALSSDMGINRFSKETEDFFIYRLCYSALGQWCLHLAKNSSDGQIGTTKYNQTNVLNELLMRYIKLFPQIANRFQDTKNQNLCFPVHIRRIYEETGYLLTDINNHNVIANYGRSITIGNTSLFFGIPNRSYTVNGLGVFSDSTEYKVSLKEFLIRDDLTYEEFLKSRFDPIDFYDKDVDITELEIFNPRMNKVPSQSWGKKIETDFTVARKSELGPYYRVLQTSDSIQFTDEIIEQQKDCFTSYEYRRLYLALKAYYNKPVKATITKCDEEYSKIKLDGHLPNREYYLMLLLSWPENNAFDRVNFIIKNDFLDEIITILSIIGIQIEGGYGNG